MSQPSKLRGWTVVSAATALNLALGVLYSWSIIAKALKEPIEQGGFGWVATQTQLPYAVACGMFAIMMVFAGRAQDKFGPRIVATIGGALVGIGLIIASFASAHNIIWAIIGFGVLAGSGIGLGYASATPPAIKWFPPAKKGLISGIVVAGFGLASVYIAPLTTTLIKGQGINSTFMILGIGFFVVSILVSQALKNPPAGYVPAAATAPRKDTKKAPAANGKHDFEWFEMIRTPQFYLLWVMFALGAAAGLLTIGSLASIVSAKIAGASTDVAVLAEAAKWSSLMVAILAIANAGGRLIAGALSDLIGRVRTMRLVFFYQAVCMLLFPELNTIGMLIVGAMMVGFNYGALLSIFPSTTGDYYGTKNFGVNYGLVFTAWGFGGVFGPIMAGMIKDATGSFQLAFQISAGLCLLAGVISFLAKAPSFVPMSQTAEEPVTSRAAIDGAAITE
ncbi:MAG TPA: OFA family MFS transporter [Candidatus Aquicultor sp.]|jgi:OFA family oxalate/formate antiporter-like MFS transporter